MGRKSKKLIRERSSQKIRPLYVIATEGAVTEEVYFKNVFRNRNIIMKLLPTKSGDSSPDKVLQRLNKHRREYGVSANEMWLVIDRDRWEINTIHSVLSECKKKGYNFILSNPCFEFWLLLHQPNPKQPLSCNECEKELNKLIPGYIKSKYKTESIEGNVHLAVQNAKNIANKNNLHNPPNTAVYELVEKLLSEEVNH